MAKGIINMQVGKQGITPAIIINVKRAIKEKKKVKVRFLKSSMVKKNRKELGEELIHRVGRKGKLLGNVVSF